MKIVGFNFTKVFAEKKNALTKSPEVKTSVDIFEIKEASSELFKLKEGLLEIKFSYSIFYEPSFASLIFEGNLLLLVDSKESKDILKGWKNKELSEEFKANVFNMVLRRANIKAVQLEEEIGIPTHFQMPYLKFEKKERKG